MDCFTFVNTLLPLLVITQVVSAVWNRTLSMEELLMSDLLENYNPSARPVYNANKTVQVYIQFSLMHVKELDIRSQVLTTTGLIIMEWRDERLRWKPEHYHGMKDIVLEPNKLWRPEFAVLIGAERIQNNYNNFRAVLSHNGNVRWEPGGVYKTMCDINITYYPFDKQHCEIIFGAWTYQVAKMNLSSKFKKINMDSYKSNGQWEIYDTDVQRNEFFWRDSPSERFSFVAFTVHMRRCHTYYVINVILPTIMTSVLLLCIFFCTPGQKVHIGVAGLLSFRIFLVNVADSIPKTSDHIPILGIYLTCTMAITTMSMVLTVLVLNLYETKDTPVPPWLRKLALQYLARVTLVCCVDSKPPEDKTTSRTKTKGKHVSPRLRSVVEMKPMLQQDTEAFISDMQRIEPPILHTRENGMDIPSDNKSIILENSRITLLDEHELCHHLPPAAAPDLPPNYAKDWQTVAKVFDRLFFLLFSCAIIISTTALFSPLINR